MGLRIRWPAAAKGVGIMIGGLVMLTTLQAALKPQAPPPLPSDVGLPQAAAAARTAVPVRPERGRAKWGQAPRRKTSVWRALRHIATRKGTTRPPQADRNSGHGTPSEQGAAPVPLPPPVPAPAPSPSPNTPPQPLPPAAPSPTPVPSPPDDGSVEFSPH